MVFGISIDTKIKWTQLRILAATLGPVDVAVAPRQTLTQEALRARADGGLHGNVEDEGRDHFLLLCIGPHCPGDTNSPTRAILILHKLCREVDTEVLITDGL